jgi:2-dehydro-3-deoxyphosphogalactonate aldolase
LSAVETACWDIVGKSLNQPIYNLLGGRVHEKLRSYTYIYPAPDEFPSAHGEGMDPIEIGDVFGDAVRAPKRAAEYVAQGFTAVKFDPIMPMSAFDPRQLSLSALANAELVVKNIREAVGDRCDLLIGTHGQPNAAGAIRLAERLEKFHPLWLEEPVPPENVDEMARVARSTKIPVATGERLASKYEFAALFAKQAASIIQPALGRVGGILEAKKIAGMAEAHYVQIAPHLYCGPVEAAANIQIATCSPNFLIQESIETFGNFHAEILKKPLEWQDGYIIPPTAPGLGVELDEEVAEANPYDDEAIFPEMEEQYVF